MKKIKLYYFNSRPNFGDVLNVYIARDIFGKDVKRSRQNRAEAVFIGSLLQSFLRARMNIFRLIKKYIRSPIKVWGTGFIRPEINGQDKMSRRMEVYALRGELTLERMRKYTKKTLNNVVLGDPGLLCSRLIDASKIEKKYDLGIIAHYVDKDNKLLEKIKIKNALIIDINTPVYDFLRQVAECRNIISSAMHGLIAADSFGIPNVRMILSDKVDGGDYKFDDYYSVFGVKAHTKIDLNKIQEFSDVGFIKENYVIKPSAVAKICDDLISVFPYKE